jgi:hypothetical protein
VHLLKLLHVLLHLLKLLHLVELLHLLELHLLKLTHALRLSETAGRWCGRAARAQRLTWPKLRRLRRVIRGRLGSGARPTPGIRLWD